MGRAVAIAFLAVAAAATPAGAQQGAVPHPSEQIAPLESFLLPIEPMSFAYEDPERWRLTRAEAIRLERLAVRLRGTSDRVAITAYAAPLSEAESRAALTLALTRGLAIRQYLTEEGVSLEQIDVTALPERAEDGSAHKAEIAPAPALAADAP